MVFIQEASPLLRRPLTQQTPTPQVTSVPRLLHGNLMHFLSRSGLRISSFNVRQREASEDGEGVEVYCEQ